MEEIHELLRERWSPRAFSPKTITPEIIDRLFEAARWAPSSRNEQPWRFIYGAKPSEDFDRLLSCLVSGNQVWAKNAALLIATVGKTNFDYKNRENRTWMHDLGLGVANLVTQATAEGLYAHQMGGVKLEEMRETLDIPEGYEPLTMIAVGYLGKKEDLPEDVSQTEKNERTRLALDEIRFEGKFKSAQ